MNPGFFALKCFFTVHKYFKSRRNGVIKSVIIDIILSAIVGNISEKITKLHVLIHAMGK